MALVTRSTEASMDASTAMVVPPLGPFTAGEDLDIAAPCYLKTSDGKVYMSNATNMDEAAEVVGFTPRAAKSGQPVTLFGAGTRFRYGSSLTVGNVFYVGATKGRLDTAVTTGDQMGVAQVVSSTDIVVLRGASTLSAVQAAQIVDGTITQVKLTAASLDGTVAKVVADANVIGGIPVIFRIDVAAGATGDVDVVMTHKVRVINAWLVKKSAAGGGAGTITVKNAANAITDAMSINVNDQIITRAASIDDATWEIAAAGTLRITRTRTASTDETCTVFVEALRVA